MRIGAAGVVVLTDAGHVKLQAATQAGDTAEQELLAPLNERQAAQFRALLERLHPTERTAAVAAQLAGAQDVDVLRRRPRSIPASG